MPRSVKDVVAHGEELAKRFEDYEPSPGDELSPEGLIALREAAGSRARAESSVIDAVALARQDGYSWRIIGSLLGTSGEAARQRYGAHGDD